MQHDQIQQGSGGSTFFMFESVPYLSEYVCQMLLRSDGRECNAGMTIAKCTKTAVLEREPRTVIHVKRANMFDPMG